MSWGDSWGYSPCRNARDLAAAFHAGRELRRGKSKVVFRPDNPGRLDYVYNGAVIAWYTPKTGIPLMVAAKLADDIDSEEQELEIRAYYCDKGEARHLTALGFEAEWQYGKKPFLIYGVAAASKTMRPPDVWKAMLKWTEPVPAPKKPRTERFVNLTMPLEFA